MVRKLTLSIVSQFASEIGGVCLSRKYTNAHELMSWQCEKGHKFKMKWNSVQQGHWCPDCGGTKMRSLSDMQILAAENNGKCLSTEYKNSRTSMLWQCQEGHKWWAKPYNIFSGNWCSICNRGEKLTIESSTKCFRERW